MFDKSPTMMQKLLRPEDGQQINTPEEVEKYKACLVFHTWNPNYAVDERNLCISELDMEKSRFLPWTFKSVNPDFAHLFITEAELAQAKTFNPITSKLEALQELSNKLHSLSGWEAFKGNAEAFAQAVEYLIDDLNETLELANDLVNQAELNIDELGQHEPTYLEEGEVEYIRAIRSSKA